jgi:hypothetical protein
MTWWNWKRVSGALARHVRVRVVNVSTRGCLVESSSRLEVGTVGMLEVEIQGRRQVEVIRVCHAVERRGHGTPYLAGVQFLELDAAPRHSVRQQAPRLEVPPASVELKD